MAFEIELPPDTQNEILSFVEDHFVGNAAQVAAVDVIVEEFAKLRANPGLGAVPRGTPFESRRLHRFVIGVGEVQHLVELLYKVNHARSSLVLTGFRRVLPPAL